MDVSMTLDTIDYKLLIAQLEAFECIRVDPSDVQHFSVPLQFFTYLKDLLFFLRGIYICNLTDNATPCIDNQSVETGLETKEKYSEIAIF